MDAPKIDDPWIPWHAQREALIVLTEYMAEVGHTGSEVAEAVRKPWAYEDLYKLALEASS